MFSLPFFTIVFNPRNTLFIRLCLFAFLTTANLHAVDESTSPSSTEIQDPVYRFKEPVKLSPHEPYIFPLEEEKVKESPEDHFFTQFMKMLGTLGMLIAVMLLASWSLKRMLNTRVQQLNDSSLMKVVEKRALSNKAFVYLVEIQNKTYVIGESLNNITLLATLPTSLEQEPDHTL